MGLVRAIEVCVAVSVPLTALIHPPEQRGGRPIPGKLRELVDGTDDEGGDGAVDLLVDRDDGDALSCRGRVGERALFGVPTEHEETLKHRLVAAVGLFVDLLSAPRALRKLHRRRLAPAEAAQPRVLSESLRVAGLVGRHRPANPHAEPERDTGVPIVGLGTVLAQQLRGADQCRRALELLRGQQAQRVAHQHRHAVASINGVRPFTDDALQPPRGQGVGDEPEIGLGLAAAGGEEQQVRERALLAALAMGRIGQRGEALQDEGELERPPRAVLGTVRFPHSPSQPQLRVSASLLDGDGVDALVPHGLIREPERVESVRVRTHQIDPLRHRVGDVASLCDDVLGRLLMPFEAGVGIVDTHQFAVEPRPVALRQGQQSHP